jgi:hypothetical protein
MTGTLRVGSVGRDATDSRFWKFSASVYRLTKAGPRKSVAWSSVGGRAGAAIAAAAILAGCEAAIVGYPDQSFDPGVELTTLQNNYEWDAIVSGYTTKSGTDKTEYRNEVIMARMRATDIQYNRFEKSLRTEEVASNIATTWAKLGLNAAGAVTGGTALKSALAATSAGIIGAEEAFDKEAFFERTLPVIIQEMRTARTQVKATILQRMNLNTTQYPIWLAVSDLDDYYYAGTLNGAVTSLSEKSAAAQVQADKDITIAVRSGREFILLGPDFEELAAAVDRMTSKPAVDALIFHPIFTTDPTARDIIDSQAIPERNLSAQANITQTFSLDQSKQFLKILILNIDRSAATLNALKNALAP